MKGKVLIVDDDQGQRAVLTALLEEDYQISTADSGAALQRAFALEQPDVVLLDVKLPDADGLALLPQVKKRWPDTLVIVLTGAPNDNEAVSWAVEAIKRGAFNFLRKNVQFDGEKLLADVQNAVEYRRQYEEASTLRRALETMSGTPSPIFQSGAMRDVVRTVDRIAPSDVTVLITGESGTGKEVIADLIHALSTRSKGQDHQDQLRRPAPRTHRKRTVRLGQGRVHRRPHRPRRPLPPGRRRHAAPRRNFRNAD